MQIRIQEDMQGDQVMRTVNHDTNPWQLAPSASMRKVTEAQLNEQMMRANLELGALSAEILEQLDPETLAKIQEIQAQISALPQTD